MIAMLNGINYV